jgi:uncharacterized membrane protein HdeD (DUF308 family)
MFASARREGNVAATRTHSPGAIIALGIVSILGGVAVLVWPQATLVAVAIILAIELLVVGVVRLVTAFTTSEASGGGRVLLVLLGVLAILAGIIFLRHPFATITVLGLLLGAFWIVAGVVELFDAVESRGVPGRGWAIAAGVLSVVAGIFVLAFTGASLVVLVWLLGLQLLLYGVLTIGRGTVMRRARHVSRAEPTVPGGAADVTGH